MLSVKLSTMKKLVDTDVLERLEEEDYQENDLAVSAVPAYATDGVAYFPELSGATVNIKEVIFEDSVFILDSRDAVHISWLKDKVKIFEDKKMFSINGKYYDANINELTLSFCLSCGEAGTLLEDSGLCHNCFTSKYSKVESYNFKPTPIFIGKQLKGDRDAPVWYGIELEHSCNDSLTPAKFRYKYSKDDSVFYYKHDGSIESSAYTCEMVTHPHSFTALMEATWLNDLKNVGAKYSASISRKNGCHIHISSTAFVDDKHYAKWYFFVYSLANGILQKIANRECTNYCQNKKIGTLLNKTKEPTDNNERTVIINERPSQTKEVRVFSTTSDPKVLKSYIQLLESTIKYSKYAKTKLSYDAWFAYVTKYNEKYAELLEVVSGISLPKPKNIVVPTKEVSVNSIYDVPTPFLGNIITITTIAEGIHKVSLCTVDFANEQVYINGRDYGLSFSSIKEVTYAK